MFTREFEKSRTTHVAEFDETSASSTPSVEGSSRRAADVNTYVEIGKSLQDLRRNVYNMVKKDAAINIGPRPESRHSPPQYHVHTSYSNRTSEYSRNEQSTTFHTPGGTHQALHIPAGDTANGPCTPPNNQAHFTPSSRDHHGDSAAQLKARVSTPYRQVPRGYDEFENIQQITAQDLNGSEDGEEHSEKVPRSRRRTGSGSGKKKSSRSRRSHVGKSGGGAVPMGSGEGGRSPADGAAHGSDSTGSSPSGSEQTEEEDSRLASAAAEVSQSIAVIVGQHEERFVNLSKEIDFWRERSSTLASQLAETDKSYNSKIEYVLAEQENLSEKQQQVLRELSAALAAHQAQATAATAAAMATSPGASGSPGSNPGAAGEKSVFSPDQVRESDLLLRQSLEKLDTLIRLTTDLKSTATPLKTPVFTHAPSATPLSEARRHAPGAGAAGGETGAHLHPDGTKPPAESPGIYELNSSPSGGKSYSPSDMRLISYQNMQHRQEDMEQMQRLYDNLTQQLRRLFEEKTQLMDELAEARSMVMDLQTRLRTEADAYQNTVTELKVEFESQLRAARLLQQEAKDQVATLRASEKRYQETERDLNMRIADLDTQLNSRVTEVTNTRTSLVKAQQRVATLQDELALAVSINEDNEVKIQENHRKTKELSKTSLSKDELIASLQREVTDLHAKIKKPFTTSVKNIENTDKRINYEYEIAMLKDSVLAIQESEAELQKEYLNLQAESKKEHKRLKDATTAEVAQLTAEHEGEMEKMRKELHSRKRHLEQQTRLRSIAEDELAELRVQFVKLEEALTQCKLENSELAHGNEMARNLTEELQDKLSAKQDEISKILTQLQRARKRIEKVELAHDEKDKAMAELNLRQQRLQQSIRSHAEREIDHLQALKHTMQSGASRLSAAEQVSTLLLKNAASPGSAASSPGFTAISTSTGAGTRDGNGPLPVSVKGRKLSLPALEAECDALWEDIPNAVETVMGELKQYHLRAVTLSADLQNTRVSSTSMSTELSTHVSRQQQEILSLKHEIETREIAARKRLDKYKTASQAEFTAQIERLKSDLTQMSQQIDSVAADKAQQVSHLRSERAAVQAELDAALQRIQDLTRQNAQLHDSSALAEKRVRTAAAEVIQEVKGLPALPLDSDVTSSSARSSPSHHTPHHFDADASIPAEHLLTTVAVQIRSKGKELARFLKSRKRSDTQQSDAMKTFVESLNSSFVSVTQSHRAHLLHDQLHLLGTVDSPIKSTTSVAHPDHSHLYAYLCGDDAELANMLTTLEESIFTTLQRSMNVETHLIHKQKEMADLRTQLADTRTDLSREQEQKATLQTTIHRLEAHLHENISEIGRTNEEMGEREAQLIRDRELLEMDLTELEERYQVSSQKNDHLESAVSNLEEELGGVQQELRDARKTLDEVFSQLQASQGKLGDMQHELRGVQYERDALLQRQAQLLQSHEAATARAQEELALSQRTIAELRAEHTAYTEQVLQLRDVVSEGNGTQFQLENVNGKLKLQLMQSEENITALTTELLETRADLNAELLRMRQSLADAQAQVEEKLVQIVSSERQIAELCVDIEVKSQTLLEESTTLRQVKDQLAYSSTALANLQINHSTLQKDHDAAVAQLADRTERNNVLGAQVDEQTTTIAELRRHVSSLQLSTHRYESFHEELTGRSEELTEQLRVYQALDTEFHELQDELTAKKEEFEQMQAHHTEEVEHFERALEEAALRQRQFEEEQEILSEKLIALAQEASEWPARQEQLEAEIAVGQGQIKAMTAQLQENEEKLQFFVVQEKVLTGKENELAQCKLQITALVAEHKLQISTLSKESDEHYNALLAESQQQYEALTAESERRIKALTAEKEKQVDELATELHETQQRSASLEQQLATTQHACEQLEELCDNLSTELQEQKQHLYDLRDVVRQRESALSVVSKQQESDALQVRTLENERNSLREKLDQTAIACTEAQIELAEKSTSLKLQMELKRELIEERDDLQLKLDGLEDVHQRTAAQLDRYKEKLEEATKELHFVQGSVERKDHTFASQRNTIRDLRESNDDLERVAKDLKAQCDSLEDRLQRYRDVESELEDCRRQLIVANLDKESLKHANFTLAAMRRELDKEKRDNELRSSAERANQSGYLELQTALVEAKSSNRELAHRADQMESYRHQAETASAQLLTATSELTTTRFELRATADQLHATKHSLETASAQLASSREEASSAKHDCEELRRELKHSTAAVEELARVKADLEHRAAVLEAENRDLQGKVTSLDHSKLELFNRAQEATVKDKERYETKIEQLHERQVALQQQLDASTRDSGLVRRTLDETQARLATADAQVESLRNQLLVSQQDHASLKLELTLSQREYKHLEEENRVAAAYKSEAEALKATCADLQRQLQQQSTERLLAEQKEVNAKNQEMFALRKELEEARLQLLDTKKYKDQFEVQERERTSVLRDLTELKVENERLQTRIKTTQMDMELSQRQYQFSSMMMAGGVGRQNPYDSPAKSDRLSSAMENISSLLKEKEAAVVQNLTAQQSLDLVNAQLTETKHHNASLHEANAKLEAKLEKLREKLETSTSLRSAEEQKSLSLRDEISALNTQLQIKVHDLQIKTQECDKLNNIREGLERRLSDELRTIQEKWLKAQGDLQKEVHVNQSLAFQVEDAKREKAAVEERYRNELMFVQKALETAKSETVAAQDQLLQVKGQGVNDKERVAILSSKVTELTNRLDQAEGRAERDKDEVNKLNVSNAALSAKLSTAAQQCRDWEFQCEQHQGRYDQLQAKYDQQMSKCEGLQGKLDMLSKEIVQALSMVERNSGKRISFGGRSDSSISIEYLVENLTSEITKYHTVYTEVAERRNDNSALEATLNEMQKVDATQRAKIQELTAELGATSKQYLEARAQAEKTHAAHKETENALLSLKTVNSEMEYMCETMAGELKQAMRRVEELDASSASMKEEWLRKMESVRAEAEARVQREVAPLQRQVSELTEKLQESTRSEQGIQGEHLRNKAEVVRLAQDAENVTDLVRGLYHQVISSGPPGSPSKAGHSVPDLFKVTSPAALLTSLQSTFNDWSREMSDLRANASIQVEAVVMKNKLIDELQQRLQQSVQESQECLQSIHAELDKIARAAAAKSAPDSPRSNPSSPRRLEGRKASFTSPGTPSADSAGGEPVSVLYHKVLRTIAAVQNQVDRTIQAQAYECEKLRTRLAQKERDYESIASIQDSAQQLQATQQEQQLQQSHELFLVKQLQQEEHAQHVQQLQLFKESMQVQHAEQIQILKETHKTQLTQQAQQLKQAQHALSRSLRERTALQEALDALKLNYAAREKDIQELGDQSQSSQAYFQTTQSRYLAQISQLEAQVERLKAAVASASTAVAAATHTSPTKVSTTSSSAREETIVFDNTVWTKEQIQLKLQELLDYRASTEQKILDFDKLIMTAFYHRDGSPDAAARGDSASAAAGAGPTPRRFKSPQHLRFDEDEDEEQDQLTHHGEGAYAFEPTSPAWRMHTDVTSTRARFHSSGSASLSPPGTLVNTASENLLSGMLQDFHHVLKEHRRLKRLCSSQQVCIMALRLLMKESDAASNERKDSF